MSAVYLPELPKLFIPVPIPTFGSCGSGSTTLPNVTLLRHRYGTR
jgi:hypothetical protein